MSFIENISDGYNTLLISSKNAGTASAVSSLLQFGGKTSSFPSIQGSLISSRPTIYARLADNSGDADIRAAGASLSSVLSLAQQSNNPSSIAGYGQIYAKTDNNLYYENSAGSVFQVTSFSGGSFVGSGAPGEITYWTSVNGLTGSTSLTYNSGILSIAGNIVPLIDDAYSLGSTTARWMDGYFGPNSVHIISKASETGTAQNWNLSIDTITNPGSLLFFNSTNTNAANSFLAIDPSGNIGIGNNTPSYGMHYGSGSGQMLFKIAGGNTGSADGGSVYFGTGGTTHAIGNTSAILGTGYNADFMVFSSTNTNITAGGNSTGIYVSQNTGPGSGLGVIIGGGTAAGGNQLLVGNGDVSIERTVDNGSVNLYVTNDSTNSPSAALILTTGNQQWNVYCDENNNLVFLNYSTSSNAGYFQSSDNSLQLGGNINVSSNTANYQTNITISNTATDSTASIDFVGYSPNGSGYSNYSIGTSSYDGTLVVYYNGGSGGQPGSPWVFGQDGFFRSFSGGLWAGNFYASNPGYYGLNAGYVNLYNTGTGTGTQPTLQFSNGSNSSSDWQFYEVYNGGDGGDLNLIMQSVNSNTFRFITYADNNTNGYEIQSPAGQFLSMFPSLGGGSYNGLVQTGDTGIIFSNGSSGTGHLTIGPWGSGGIRIDSSGNVAIGTTSVSSGSVLTTAGNILPSADNTYSLGSSSFRWAEGYFGPNSVHIQNGSGTGPATTNLLTYNQSTAGDSGTITGFSIVGGITSYNQAQTNGTLTTTTTPYIGGSPYQGTQCLKFVGNSGFINGPAIFFSCSPSTQYTFSLYFSTTSSPGGYFNLAAIDNTGTRVVSANNSFVTGSWNRYSVTITTSATASTLELALCDNGVGAYYNIDAIQLQTGSSATTWVAGVFPYTAKDWAVGTTIGNFTIQENNASATYLTITGASTSAGTVGGSVGIGTTNVINKLDINGSVAIGAGSTAPTAPSNGLYVGGKVGIATNGATNALDVSGAIAVGTYAGANTAPTSGAIISGSVGIGNSSPSLSATGVSVIPANTATTTTMLYSAGDINAQGGFRQQVHLGYYYITSVSSGYGPAYNLNNQQTTSTVQVVTPNWPAAYSGSVVGIAFYLVSATVAPTIILTHNGSNTAFTVVATTTAGVYHGTAAKDTYSFNAGDYLSVTGTWTGSNTMTISSIWLTIEC